MEFSHCKKVRPVLEQNCYILNSKIDQYPYQCFGITVCDFCKQLLLGWYGCNHSGEALSETFVIKQKDQEKWLNRIDKKSAVYDVICKGLYSSKKDTRKMVFVSDYTKMIVRPTESIFEALLHKRIACL